MSFYIENRTYGYADINLFDGSRVCLNKGENFPVKHIPTESEKRYYSKLNCLGIYLVEHKDSKEETVTPSSEETVIPPVVESSDIVTGSDGLDSETSTEVSGNKEISEEIDYTKESVNDLMKLRQAELIEIAHKLGHSDVTVDFAKKEIVKLIRGE